MRKKKTFERPVTRLPDAPYPVDPRHGYSPREVPFEKEEQFAREMREAIHTVAHYMNTGKKHNIKLNFNIEEVNGVFVPTIQVSKIL